MSHGNWVLPSVIEKVNVKLAGKKGRFFKYLVSLILKKGTKNDLQNPKISPKIRQVLQHWGYVITEKDFDYEVALRKL